MDQFDKMDKEYYALAKEKRSTFEAIGCLYPCNYTHYKIGAEIKQDLGLFGLGLAFGSTTVNIHTEYYLYPFISFISDLGGSFGLFVGFSFFAVFDILKDFLLVLRKTIK